MPGHKIRCVQNTYGSENDTENAFKLLEIGAVYTIDYTRVHKWSNEVFLIEFPGVTFSSINFEDIETPSIETMRQHPDFIKFSQKMGEEVLIRNMELSTFMTDFFEEFNKEQKAIKNKSDNNERQSKDENQVS